MFHLVLRPLKVELWGEQRLERPLSLAELVSLADVWKGESGLHSSFRAESGLSG